MNTSMVHSPIVTAAIVSSCLPCGVLCITRYLEYLSTETGRAYGGYIRAINIVATMRRVSKAPRIPARYLRCHKGLFRQLQA